jgi:hypothetical protein
MEVNPMRARPFTVIRDKLGPTEDDDYNVVILQYDTFKAPPDEDYVTAPFKFDSLEEVGPLPERPGTERTVIHQDGRSWNFEEELLNADDPPDWFGE